ncbi:uncharacterized protein KGF55_005477 [Candida pseudojiufengensis]|uniref:uncharacterized protein n=1 Tax=Candida pseudojiufengensis TaxID=497109 RepID=UPI00222410E0|nr:uncharacterized protein KGF55_005477 [Candida pseudojiufengensis]KAI5959134.1 hypothetical protein KGF55_005477 [Candida pseudojiufengensis]
MAYTEEDLQEVIKIYKESLESGNRISYNKLGKRFNIPSHTIRSRINKPSTKPRPPPKQSILTLSMQNELREWLYQGIIHKEINCSKEVIRQNAEYIYKREFPNGKVTQDDIKIFIEGDYFLKSELSDRNCRSKGSLTIREKRNDPYFRLLPDFDETFMKPIIDQWHFYVSDWIFKNNVPANRIYNLEEICFDITNGVSQLQTKYVDEEDVFVSRYEKWNLLTSILIISLSGEILPPVIIHKRENINSNHVNENNNNPTNWLYGTTNSGWTTSQLLLTLLKNHLTKLMDAGKDKPPIGLILNGNVSHKSIEFQDYCKQNNIQLLYVPTPSKTIAQPCNNLVENVIKKQWQGLKTPINEIDPNLSNYKNDFIYNYKLALEKLTPPIIQSAWEEAGILSPL